MVDQLFAAPARTLTDPKDLRWDQAQAEAKLRRPWIKRIEAGSGRVSAAVVAEYEWQTARLNALVRRIGT